MPWRKWPTTLKITTEANVIAFRTGAPRRSTRALERIPMQKFGKHLKVVAGLMACLGALLATGSLCAQTNAPKAKFPPNRFLFVIDTSKGMAPRAEGTLKALEEMLLSELNGQMRSGDSM